MGGERKVLGKERHHLGLHPNHSCAAFLRLHKSREFPKQPCPLRAHSCASTGSGSAVHTPSVAFGQASPGRDPPCYGRPGWGWAGAQGRHSCGACSRVFPLTHENSLAVLSAASCCPCDLPAPSCLPTVYSLLFPSLDAPASLSPTQTPLQDKGLFVPCGNPRGWVRSEPSLSQPHCWQLAPQTLSRLGQTLRTRSKDPSERQASTSLLRGREDVVEADFQRSNWPHSMFLGANPGFLLT